MNLFSKQNFNFLEFYRQKAAIKHIEAAYTIERSTLILKEVQIVIC
jgi:hypothetical protein